MHFDQKTMELIQELSKEERFAWFFDKLGRDDKETPRDLFNELAHAFAVEFDIPEAEEHKLAFLAELGWVAAKLKAVKKD